MTLEQRLDALGRIDIAGVTDRYRNDIRRIYLSGDSTDAERQIKWWEDAFGEGRASLAHRILALRDDPIFSELLQTFGRSSQELGPAFDRLALAIRERSLRGFRRWRFIASLYANRVERFVERLDTDERARRLGQELTGSLRLHDTRQYRIMDANLTARRQQIPGIESNSPRSCANYSRCLEILGAIALMEEARTEQIRRRDELVDSLRDQGGEDEFRGARVNVATLSGEIRDLEQALRRKSAEPVRTKAAYDANRVARDLRQSFGFYPEADGPDLMSHLIRLSLTKREGS